jgi:4-hydroxy-3-polyprenylbenzoate decarboxylase
MGAAISSGSFKTDGMIVAPCSAKTLAAIAHGFGDNLIHRAADVILKERRTLLLAVREAPLSEIHLEKHVEAVANGGRDPAAGAGVLQPPAHDRRCRRSHGSPHA